jgi:branched-subunit amino acid ABC-type transport system permease component
VGFSFNGVSGVFIMAPLTSLALIMALYYLFTRTRVGLAIRAVAENSDLSAVFGVNTNHIHRLSWFIVGALSGLSGAIIPLWTTVRGGYGEEMLMTVMAGSLIGGLDNIVGAVVGGVTIALFQEWFVGAMMNYKLDGVPLLVNFSTLIHGYSKLIPLVFIVLVLMLLPGGVTQYIRKKGWALDKPEKQME